MLFTFIFSLSNVENAPDITFSVDKTIKPFNKISNDLKVQLLISLSFMSANCFVFAETILI